MSPRNRTKVLNSGRVGAIPPPNEIGGILGGFSLNHSLSPTALGGGGRRVRRRGPHRVRNGSSRSIRRQRAASGSGRRPRGVRTSGRWVRPLSRPRVERQLRPPVGTTSWSVGDGYQPSDLWSAYKLPYAAP